MVSTILVPLDGSGLSRHALPYASCLAQAMNARLVLFHAYRSKPDDGEADPELDLVREQADLAAGLRQRGINATTWLSYDEPGPAIVAAAADLQADLIVMSTHGRGGVTQLMYGSVADGIVRSASVPIMLVTAHARTPWTDGCAPRLLLPLDGSPFAEAALGAAGTLARSLGAKIVLLTIPARHPSGLEALEETDRYLERVATWLRADGHDVEVRVQFGSPVQVIASVADELGPTLVVMATHGRGVLSRFVVESIASETLRKVAAPVLLIRPQQASVEGDTPHSEIERSAV